MNGSGQIKGITFDVGGTLMEPWPSVGHVYAEVAAGHGLKDIPADRLNARFKAAWQATPDFDYTRDGWERLVHRTFHGLIPVPGRIAFFPALYDRFAEPEAWRVFDDVRPALQELASLGLRLGVISNWDERLRVLLKRLQLDRYFESFAISCEVGAAKPSPVIFEQAARQLALPPAALLHIGDDRDLDVRGATAAGFRALRIVRGAAGAGDGELPSLAGLRSSVLI